MRGSRAAVLVGAHMSVEGGVHRAVERAEAYGMTALQVFTRTARAWRAPPLAEEEADLFRERLRASGVRAVVAHASYLANPASPDRWLRRRSERALEDELTRCERLGIPWLVLHPGSHLGVGSGLARAGGVLRRVLRATSGFRAGMLVENQAGQGNSVGGRFRDLAAILALAGDGDRLGVCLDTCHAFAYGHDLASEAGFRRLTDEIDGTVGLSRLHVVHVNDCPRPRGSRVDRHAGLGLGAMGVEAFRRVVRHPVLGRLPLILETPKGEEDGEDLDARNLRLLRSFYQGTPEGLA